MCSKASLLAATHDAWRSSQSRSSLPGSCQERTAAQARATSAMSERDTVTNCKHLPLDHVPSPQGERVQVWAAGTMTLPLVGW